MKWLNSFLSGRAVWLLVVLLVAVAASFEIDFSTGIDEDLKHALMKFQKRNNPQLWAAYRRAQQLPNGQDVEHSFSAAAALAREVDKALTKQQLAKDLERKAQVSESPLADRQRASIIARLRRRDLQASEAELSSYETSFHQIALDLPRSRLEDYIPKSSPLYNTMRNDLITILKALSVDAPHVGYAQGMNLFATMCLIHKIPPQDVYALMRMMVDSDIRKIWNFHNEPDFWAVVEERIMFFLPDLYMFLKETNMEELLYSPASGWFNSLAFEAMDRFGPSSYETQHHILKNFLYGEFNSTSYALALDDVFLIPFAALHAKRDVIRDLTRNKDEAAGDLVMLANIGLWEDWVKHPEHVDRDIREWRRHKHEILQKMNERRRRRLL